jgi:hypothetical protein
LNYRFGIVTNKIESDIADVKNYSGKPVAGAICCNF